MRLNVQIRNVKRTMPETDLYARWSRTAATWTEGRSQRHPMDTAYRRSVEGSSTTVSPLLL